MFNPDRLRIARKRRRMSSKQLAERTGLTAVTITRLEKFRNEPEPETVQALVKALDFPREFFFGPDIDELNKDAASFRSLTSMTAKEREAALAAGALAYMLSGVLARLLFNLRRHSFPPGSPARTDAAADPVAPYKEAFQLQ